jgi:hypothetical protein
MSTASLIKEISGYNTCVTDSTQFINKTILCSENNNQISPDVLNSLDEQIKNSVDSIL